MKKVMIIIAFGLIVGLTHTYAQNTENTTTSTTSSYTSSQTTPQDKAPISMSAIAIGAVAVVVLGGLVLMMVRNRRKNIGGIQRQDKPDPSPATTQSINNPGSGV